MEPGKLTTFPHVRWMIQRDMREVLEIEQLSYPAPMSETTYRENLQCRNVIGMVAEAHDLVLGVMLYSIHRHKLDLIRLCVHPEWRRNHVGTYLINCMIHRIGKQSRIVAWIAPENVPANDFLRSCGFRCVLAKRGCHLKMEYHKETT